jgi:hypothetical protein
LAQSKEKYKRLHFVWQPLLLLLLLLPPTAQATVEHTLHCIGEKHASSNIACCALFMCKEAQHAWHCTDPCTPSVDQTET